MGLIEVDITIGHSCRNHHVLSVGGVFPIGLKLAEIVGSRCILANLTGSKDLRLDPYIVLKQLLNNTSLVQKGPQCSRSRGTTEFCKAKAGIRSCHLPRSTLYIRGYSPSSIQIFLAPNHSRSTDSKCHYVCGATTYETILY